MLVRRWWHQNPKRKRRMSSCGVSKLTASCSEYSECSDDDGIISSSVHSESSSVHSDFENIRTNNFHKIENAKKIKREKEFIQKLLWFNVTILTHNCSEKDMISVRISLQHSSVVINLFLTKNNYNIWKQYFWSCTLL